MNCQTVRDRILELAGRPEPEIENHLRTCAACAQVRQEQLALWRRLDEWTAPEISPGFDARLFRRLEGRSNWLARWLGPVQPALAGALACLVLLAGVVLDRARHVPAPPEPPVAAQGWDREMDTALDDMQMLSEFEILPVAQAGEGKS